MSAAQFLNLPVLLGGFLLLWAVAARRSRFDSVVIGLAGLLLIFWAFREQLGPVVMQQVGYWPELALGLLGLVMLLRVFLSRLGWPHRVGLGLAGCAISLPLLVLIGLIALFSMGSGHDRNRPPAANAVQGNSS